MKLLVIGGCGYIGARLVPQLLGAGHIVSVRDLQWFGDGMLPNSNDSLDVHQHWLPDWTKYEAVIYLAGLTSDAMCQQYRWATNETNIRNILHDIEAIGKYCKRLIFASSVAIYGSTEHTATTDTVPHPTTIYSRGKLLLEGAVRYYHDNAVVIRAASVCGRSERMRFDTPVNRMVRDGVMTGKIMVNGGNQWRTHVHMDDLCDFYQQALMLKAGTYNVVGENQQIKDTASLASEITGAKVDTGKATDDRSYRVESSLQFNPKRSIREAMLSVKAMLEAGACKDAMTDPRYMNEVSIA